MNDRTVRNLAHLQESASTARVLNLLRVWNRHARDPEYATAPLFRHALLNRAIFLKHRLRRHEQGDFYDGRQTATKIIVPIDGSDLSVGGRSVFVGQINYDAIMQGVLGETWLSDSRDRDLLEILEDIPSFDPFLLREHLKRHNREPARCYFEISEADMTRMHRFVEHEVQKLIDLCYAGVEGSSNAQSTRLVKKILSNTVDAETEPLRMVLRLERPQYQEGVFCWKGFLYYKWTLAEAMPQVIRVADAIAEAKPKGAMDMETKAYLEKSRTELRTSIMKICETARRALKVYDDAFASLIGGQPTAFRDFLLGAPAMFTNLGERLGAISHITSFWQFRFPQGRLPPSVTPEELAEIFNDFEGSLSFPELQPGARARSNVLTL